MADGAASDVVKSTMPGTITKVLAKVGDLVKAGQTLVSMISMKNEYVFKADRDGTIKSVRVKEGQDVPKNHVMVEMEE